MRVVGEPAWRVRQTVAVAWDAARPVPWKRLVVPFGIYAVIAVVMFSFVGKGDLLGPAVGVLIGGVLYLGVTFVLVKFGWNPPTWGAGARADEGRSAKTATATKPSTGSAAPRAKPSPTARTNAGNPRAKRGR